MLLPTAASEPGQPEGEEGEAVFPRIYFCASRPGGVGDFDFEVDAAYNWHGFFWRGASDCA